MWISLAVFAGANLAAAASGGIFRPGAWYENLRKPPWTPPNLAFPIVWFVLYALNAASGWLVWQAAGAAAAAPLAVYGLGLVVNAAWSALFFGAKRMDWAMADVALLWLCVAATAALFAPISGLAAALQLPYLAWVSLAATLNARMIALNPARG